MTTTPDTFTNYATSTVAGGAGGIGSNLAAGDTTLFVQSGDGAKYPSTAPFMLQFGTVAPYELARCTNRSGDVLTIVRGQEGTSAATWAVGVTVEQVASAGNLANLWAAITTGRLYFAEDYGTVGGTADNVAINAAIAAAAANGGGIVLLAPRLYKTNASVVLAQNVALWGGGATAGNTNAGTGHALGATVIQPQSGATYDAIRTPLPPTPGTAGYIQYGVSVRDLSVDCSLMLGTTAGQGNGVHFYGVRYGLLQNVDVFNSPNWGFLIEGDNPTNYAYNTTLIDCTAGGPCAAGFRFTNSEQCSLVRCVSEGASTACAASQPYSGSQASTAAYQLYANVGWIDMVDCTFGNLGTTTADAIFCDNGETCTVVDCLFDKVRGPAFHSSSGGHLIAHNRLVGVCSATSAAAIKLGGGAHVVEGNIFQTQGGPANWTYCVEEEGAYVGNLIGENQFVQGTYGAVRLNSGSTAPRAHDNVGYNPAGAQLNPPASPTISATGSGGTLTAGTYQVKVSYVNAVGETTASVSGSTSVATGQNLQITSPAASGNATGWYAYVTQAGGATFLRQQANGSPTAIGANLTLTTNPSATGLASAPVNTSGVATPAVPASGTAQANNSGVSAMVYVTGGTVSAIAIGGATTGLTAGAFRVPAGQTIAVTYSVAPTWQWMGD